ncbi:MAG: hypothetical protein OEU54_13665, partial [Gemmatimonadota bacterium]|nr:hypothetical protein [Gemmatimonadota bacterium]
NHHLYPRIITTAASAWAELGRDDFERHVLVIHRARVRDWVATILIKMTPWTVDEVAHIEGLSSLSTGEFTVAERPGDAEDGFVPIEFFSGEVPAELLDRIPYRVGPVTDDRPYFNFTRKSLDHLSEDRGDVVDRSVAAFLNEPLRGGIPLDIAHLFVVGGICLVLASVFVLLPLSLSPAGRSDWRGKAPMLTYFALLGAGFIMIELTLLSMLIKTVGFPLHTFALVIFVLLAGAGGGSALAARFDVTPERRWYLPFVAVLAIGALFLATYDAWSARVLSAPAPARAAVAGLAILPLGVALGMPFPLGILWASRRHEGAVAWGWAMNGLFTAAGGVAASLLALTIGLRLTLAVGFALYVLAFLMFRSMRAAS